MDSLAEKLSHPVVRVILLEQWEQSMGVVPAVQREHHVVDTLDMEEAKVKASSVQVGSIQKQDLNNLNMDVEDPRQK